MSTVKLNPILDLGLNPNDPVPEMADQLPRELAMDSVNTQTSLQPASGFSGIMDISSAKEMLNTPAPAQSNSIPAQQIPTQLSPESITTNNMVVPNTQPMVAPMTQPTVQVSQSEQGSAIWMVLAVLLFLGSLAAAAYFLYLYYFA